MAQRVGRVVGQGPRRRIGFGTAGAALIAVLVLFIAGVFAAAPSAKTDHQTQPASRTRLTPQQQGASNFVNGLLSKMTVAEKFGQLEMSGPQGPNGTAGQSLIDDAKNGLVGSILDMVGVDNINQLQQAALQSRLHIPLIFSLDVIHGYKTMYPISLGESSSWDPALARARRVDGGRGGRRRRHQVDLQPDGRRHPRPALGPRAGHQRRGPVPRRRARGRPHPRLSGLELQRPGQDGRHDQALRGVRRPGRRP